MGDESLEFSRPPLAVKIKQPYYLAKYPLTQKQWNKVMDTRPSEFDPHPYHPQDGISWADVKVFIRLLNQLEETDLYRLPTEAEWEYACRAGATTRWSFGDDENRLGEYAWYKDNAWDQGEQYAHSEGVKLPNPWGLYDMHGNVWEWVQDWFSEIYYSNSPSVDPQGAETGIRRVRKGADFHYYVRGTRSARRGRSVPDFRKPTIGARLLRQEP